MSRDVKVFAMNDCDWMAGESLESVKTEYLEKFSGGLPADEALDNPHELTEEEMDTLQFSDEPGAPAAAKRSFREQLDKLIAEGQTFPCFFASTEY